MIGRCIISFDSRSSITDFIVVIDRFGDADVIGIDVVVLDTFKTGAEEATVFLFGLNVGVVIFGILIVEFNSSSKIHIYDFHKNVCKIVTLHDLC